MPKAQPEEDGLNSARNQPNVFGGWCEAEKGTVTASEMTTVCCLVSGV